MRRNRDNPLPGRSRLRVAAARLLLGGLWLPTASLAHSFDIAVIAPYTGAQGQTGPNLWHGMRVATREFDGHPFETADGHLGGVDSNLIRIDSTQGAESVVAQLRPFADLQNVVIAVLAPGLAGLREAWPDDLPSVVVLSDPGEARHWPDAFAPPLPSGELGESFGASYRHTYDQPPDAIARGGYVAARLIAAAIRPFDGHFDDPPALRESFAARLGEAERQQTAP